MNIVCAYSQALTTILLYQKHFEFLFVSLLTYGVETNIKHLKTPHLSHKHEFHWQGQVSVMVIVEVA